LLLAWTKTGATVQSIEHELLANTVFPVPPLADQHAISDFLDGKTAAIDALIAKKERLIELVEEKRQATITRAVTKGLDPDVPMKDSGVEWLGEVPAHWDVPPLFARYSVQLGKMLSPEAVAGMHPAPYLRNANVQWDHIVLDDLREMSFSPIERHKFALKVGDLLVCEGGDVGRTALWRGELAECFYQKAIHRLRPFRPMDNSRFFYYAMCAAAHRGAFLADGNQSTIVHLTAEKLKRHRFAFPPIREQNGIVDYLDRQVQRINTMIEREGELITRLREFRQTLISAAVTGQLDLRSRTTRAAKLATPEPLEEVLT
jgi:type I restriction enzyme S subunit